MLKYYFTVLYHNDTTFEQNKDDVSTIVRPGKGSAFTDVKVDEVATFTLQGEGHTYGVSLIDGHFEVDGVPFFMHEVGGIDNEVMKDFRLIYYRQHRHGLHQNQEISHETVYRFGWQCTVNGKNYQQIMQLL